MGIRNPIIEDTKGPKVASIDPVSSRSEGAKSGRHDPVEVAFCYYSQLARARAYIDSRPLKAINLADVAAAIGVSPSRLSHLFTEKIGITFSAWLRRRRVSKAVYLLHNRHIPLAEVAELSGFSSYRSFARSFKKIEGIAPSAYRTALQAQLLTKIQQEMSGM